MKLTPIRAAIGIAVIAAIALGVRALRRTPVDTHVACASEREDAIRVLFIGNSHTFVNDLPKALCDMGAASKPPVPLAVTEVVAPGYTLANHLSEGSAARAIDGSRWTWVVLQEQSQMVFIDPAGASKSVHTFDAMIHHAHAQTAIFAVQAHRDATEPAIAQADYARIATEVGAKLVPVGGAWIKARATIPGLEPYQADGYHPRPEGTYLGACVFYTQLTGRSPVGLPAHVGSITLDANVAAALQRIAE